MRESQVRRPSGGGGCFRQQFVTIVPVGLSSPSTLHPPPTSSDCFHLSSPFTPPTHRAMQVVLLGLLASSTFSVNGFTEVCSSRLSRPQHGHKISFLNDLFTTNNKNNASESPSESENKLTLLKLLSDVQPNESTPRDLTSDILQAVSVLECECPTPDSEVLSSLAGNWELIWTAQDVSSLPNQNNPFRNWIK